MFQIIKTIRVILFGSATLMQKLVYQQYIVMLLYHYRQELHQE